MVEGNANVPVPRGETFMRIQAISDRIAQWRRERELSHVTGHVEPNPYMPEGQGTEIELFVPEDPRLSSMQ